MANVDNRNYNGNLNRDDNYYQMKADSDRRKQESKDRYLEQSKNRLGAIQKKKMQTTFIGAISEIEKSLGFLWGYFDEHELDEDEIKIKKVLEKAGFDEQYFGNLWDDLRNRILNNGNNQLRALQQELELYTVNWNRYNVKMSVMSELRENNHE